MGNIWQIEQMNLIKNLKSHLVLQIHFLFLQRHVIMYRVKMEQAASTKEWIRIAMNAYASLDIQGLNVNKVRSCVLCFFVF